MNAYVGKIKFLLFVIAVALFWYLGRFFNIDPQRFRCALGQFPPLYSGALFVLLYVVVTFFIWFSKDIFRLAAALLFGPYLSTLLVFTAESLNAVILFNFSRLLARGFVEASLKEKYAGLDRRLGEVNIFWLLLFRMTPLLPFRFLDLAAGLSRLSFKKYAAAVVLGSPVRIFWLQYILAGVGEAIFKRPEAVAEYLLSNKPVFIASLAYLALVILAAAKIKIKE